MSFSAADAHWMRRALAYARRGGRAVHPNPLVGAVIVHEGREIGGGWHRRFGDPHAEIEALARCRSANGATLYVTLEPCNHWGKTPPCVDTIVAAGFKRIVIAAPDPNPHVTGGGAKRLEMVGIETQIGCLEAVARELNRGWYSMMESGRPLVAVHIVASLDGRRMSEAGVKLLINDGPGARSVERGVHQFDAALIDYSDERVASESSMTLLFGSAYKVCKLPEDVRDSTALLTYLRQCGQQGIQSLIATGGSKIGEMLLESGLCDRLIIRHQVALLGNQGLPFVSSAAGASMLKGLRLLWTRALGSPPLGKQFVSCYTVSPKF